MKTFIIEYWTSYCGEPAVSEVKKVEAENLEDAKQLATEFKFNALELDEEIECMDVLSAEQYLAELPTL